MLKYIGSVKLVNGPYHCSTNVLVCEARAAALAVYWWLSLIFSPLATHSPTFFLSFCWVKMIFFLCTGCCCLNPSVLWHWLSKLHKKSVFNVLICNFNYMYKTSLNKVLKILFSKYNQQFMECIFTSFLCIFQQQLLYK